MIKSIRLDSFKIYRGSNYIDTNGSKFIAIVGRNGSGKSALVDGIIWCAFERGVTKNKFLRIKSNLELINKEDLNNGITYTEVAVEFINPLTYDILIITKRLDINKSSKTIGTYMRANENDYDSIIHVRGTDIDNILQDKFNINHENFNRIVLTQNTTQMVNYTQLDLLHYMEKCCCTDKLVNDINILEESVKQYNDKIIIIHEEYESLYQQYNDILPNANKAIIIRKDLRCNEYELLKLMKKKMKRMLMMEADDHERKDLLNDGIEQCSIELTTMKGEYDNANRSFDTIMKQERITSNKYKKLIVLHEEVGNDITTTSGNIKRRLKEIERDTKQRTSTTDKITSSKKAIKGKQQQIKKIETQLTSKTAEKANLDGSITITMNKVRKVGDDSNDDDITTKIRQSLVQLSCLDDEAKKAISITEDAINRKEMLYLQQMESYKKRKYREESIRRLTDDITNASSTLKLQKLQMATLKKALDDAKSDKTNRTKLYDDMKLEVNKKQASSITNEFLRKCSMFINNVTSELSHDDKSGVYGMLCDIIQPIDPDVHTIPLLEVLGSSLTHTLIVKSRKIALFVAQKCKEEGIYNLTIDIVDEIGAIDRNRIDQAVSGCKEFTPLIDCVNIKSHDDDDVVNAVCARLKKWCLFKGTINNTSTSSIWAANKHFNIVSLDGSRFFQDGEIRMNRNINKDTPQWSVCCGNTNKNTTTSSFTENDLHQLSTHIYALDSKIQILNHSLKETVGLYDSSTALSMKLKDDMKKEMRLQDSDKNDHCEKPDDTLLKKEKRILDNIISSYNDTKGALDDTITNLIGSSANSKKLISLLQLQENLHQEILNLNININIIKRECESLDQDIKSNENKISKLDKQIEKKVTVNDKDTTTMMQLREISDMMKEEILSSFIGLKRLSDLLKDLKAKRNEQNKYLLKLQNEGDNLKKRKEKLQQEMMRSNREKAAMLLAISEKTQWLRALPQTQLPVLKLKDQHDDDNDDDDNDDDSDFETVDKKILNKNNVDNSDDGFSGTSDMSNSNDDEDAKLEEDQLRYRCQQLHQQYQDCGRDSLIENVNAVYQDLLNHKLMISDLKKRKFQQQSKINKMQLERFAKDKKFLEDVNTNLSVIVNELLPNSDCYLSYGDTPVSLFREGITLLSKQRDGNFRELKVLSGGQQSIFCLSLSLSIQEIFPSTFWIMDEIDAALDIIVVSNLAKLIQSKARSSFTQFLVVTHRPEMYSEAESLLGLYLINNAPSHLTINNSSNIHNTDFMDEEKEYYNENI